ncbi:MAG: ABC transporter permease [Candidatus Lokiarchaeota archaeon]|nr:ABC transporter permease [Candidatus Lokiarchaeota archaeon]
MNGRRIIALAKKDVKKTFRDPATLFMAILFPLILTVAFGLAFGGISTGSERTYDLAVIDQDTTMYAWADNFKGNISQNGMLHVVPYTDVAVARQDLAEGKIDAIVIIPADFGTSCQSFLLNPSTPGAWTNTSISMYLDSGSMIITQTIPPVLYSILVDTLVPGSSGASLPVNIGLPALVSATKLSQFDYMAPGLVAYAGIFLTMTVAQGFTNDKEKGLIKRINVTPATAGDVMAGHATSNMAIALLQTTIVFSVAALMGFGPGVGFASYLMAFCMALVFSLCNVGFGLITAAVAKNAGSATGISFLFIIPQMFFGTFITMPQDIARFVPSYYITDAITSLFLRGAPVFSSTIVLDLLVLVLVSIGVFVFGVFAYKRFGNK